MGVFCYQCFYFIICISIFLVCIRGGFRCFGRINFVYVCCCFLLELQELIIISVFCFGIFGLTEFLFCLLCAGVGKWMRSWKRRSRRRWASWTPSPPPRDQQQPQTQEIDITKQLNLSKSFTISKNRRCATHSIPRPSVLLMFFFFNFTRL